MKTNRKSSIAPQVPAASTINQVRTSLTNSFGLIRGAIGATLLLIKSI